jgi:uncharacterized C2H2 Zn-finger protein
MCVLLGALAVTQQLRPENVMPPREASNRHGANFACTMCDKKFRWSSGLSEHVRNTHGHHAIPVCCDICTKVFKNTKSLNSHVYHFHGIRKKILS